MEYFFFRKLQVEYSSPHALCRISFHLLNELWKVPRNQLSLQLECLMCVYHVIRLIVFVSMLLQRANEIFQCHFQCVRYDVLLLEQESLLHAEYSHGEWGHCHCACVTHMHTCVTCCFIFPYAQELHQINGNISSRKFTGWQLVYDFPSDKYVTSKSSSVNISKQNTDCVHLRLIRRFECTVLMYILYAWPLIAWTKCNNKIWTDTTVESHHKKNQHILFPDEFPLLKKLPNPFVLTAIGVSKSHWKIGNHKRTRLRLLRIVIVNFRWQR